LKKDSILEEAMSEIMSKEKLIQAFADAYERVIATANEAARRGITRKGDQWGPRETIAHLAGWEVMASVRIPRFTTGSMTPFDFEEGEQQEIMNDAINAAFVAIAGDQSLDALCRILRQAYQRVVELLRPLDERFFQSGEYVYERTASAIEHCQEHGEELID
jgi:hypothetical protein